jgi:RND family efflux transporter MFP subunit
MAAVSRAHAQECLKMRINLNWIETAGRGSGIRVAALAAIAVAASVAASGCGRKAREAEPRPAAAAAQKVETVVVRRTAGAGEVGVPALVQARQRAVLSARVPASVVELPFREGERVGAGAVVVRLDDAALRSSLSAAEAAARVADSDLTRAESLLAKGAATPRERDEMAARTAAAQAAVTGAKDSLSYAVLRSPFAGVVAARPARVGDVVSPGASLIEIEGEGGLELRATLDAEQAARAQVGLSVRAQVDGQREPLIAVLRALSPAGDPATHRFEVKADLPQAPGLRSGLFARLLLPAPGAEPRLLVPSSALFQRGGLTGVFVVADGRARLRWVAPGAREGSLTEVRAGLDAGERVAVAPAGLVDGASLVEER